MRGRRNRKLDERRKLREKENKIPAVNVKYTKLTFSQENRRTRARGKGKESVCKKKLTNLDT